MCSERNETKDVRFNMRKKIDTGFEDTKGLLRGVSGFLEVLLLSVMYYIVWRVGYDDGLFPNYFHKGKYVLMGVYALLLILILQNFDGFLFGRLRKTDVVLAQWIAILLVNFVIYWQLCLIANQLISVVPILILFAGDMLVALFFVIATTAVYHHFYAPHSMIMVFGGENSVVLKIKMDARQDKYLVKKLISVEEGYEKICSEILKFDAAILTDIPAQIRNDLLKFCYRNRIRVYIAPKISDIILRGGEEINLFDTPLLRVKGVGLTLTQRIVKRSLDIILSVIAMVIALPIMLVIAAAIKLEDGGPVFYKQKRLTLNGREFNILKFRSMIVDAEKYAGAVLAEDNDPRITKIGKLIRATRLDELPQILNILKGDMSIVGPRPERKCFADEFSKEIPEFEYRLKVKGGLTGYAQIYGKYKTSAYDKLRLDLMYIESYSIVLDIKLMLLTLRIMFSKDSTEGIDKAREREKRRDELIHEMNNDRDASATSVGSKD